MKMQAIKGLDLHLVGLSLIAIGIIFYLLYINSIRWDPLFLVAGKTVEYQDIHKLGKNYFIYQDRSYPFTGWAVKRDKQTKELRSKTYFRDGMIHHRDIFKPNSSSKIMEVAFINESVSKVSFFDGDGQLKETSSDAGRITELIRQLDYGRYYDDDPL